MGDKLGVPKHLAESGPGPDMANIDIGPKRADTILLGGSGRRHGIDRRVAVWFVGPLGWQWVAPNPFPTRNQVERRRAESICGVETKAVALFVLVRSTDLAPGELVEAVVSVLRLSEGQRLMELVVWLLLRL